MASSGSLTSTGTTSTYKGTHTYVFNWSVNSSGVCSWSFYRSGTDTQWFSNNRPPWVLIVGGTEVRKYDRGTSSISKNMESVAGSFNVTGNSVSVYFHFKTSQQKAGLYEWTINSSFDPKIPGKNPNRPTTASLSDPIYCNKEYTFDIGNGNYAAYNYNYTGFYEHSSSYTGNGQGKDIYSIIWDVYKIDYSYDDPNSDGIRLSRTVTLNTPTITSNGTPLYGSNYRDLVSVTFSPDSPTSPNYTGWSFLYSNSSTYPGASWTDNVDKIYYPYVACRAKVVVANFNDSAFTDPIYFQVKLRPVSEFSTNSVVYYNETIGSSIQTITKDAVAPNGTVLQYAYMLTDDSTATSFIEDDPSPLNQRITHPYLRLGVREKLEPYIPSAWIYCGSSSTVPEGSYVPPRQVTLNAPTSISFATNPITVAYKSTGTYVIPELIEELSTAYTTSLSSDISDNKTPSLTTINIKNSVDNIYVAGGSNVPATMNYNNAYATAYYNSGNYIDSATTSTSQNLKVVNTLTIDNDFSVSFTYNDSPIESDAIIPPSNSITITCSGYPSSKAKGRLNWIRIYAYPVNPSVNNGQPVLLSNAYSLAFNGSTTTRTITLENTGASALVPGEAWYLKVQPVYMSEEDNYTLEDAGTNSDRSFDSPRFFFGSVPDDIVLLYPSPSSAKRTISRRIPLCFKVPPAGTGASYISRIVIKLAKDTSGNDYPVDPSTIITWDKIVDTSALSSGNPVDHIQSNGVTMYLTQYNTSTGTYSPYSIQPGSVNIPSGVYVTIALDTDTEYTDRSHLDSLSHYFIYSIEITNDIGVTHAPQYFIITQPRPFVGLYEAGVQLSKYVFNDFIKTYAEDVANYYNVLFLETPIFPSVNTGDIVTASQAKALYQDIIYKIYQSKNNINTGGFPHHTVSVSTLSPNITNMVAGKEIQTDNIEDNTIYNQNYKKVLSSTDGQYYDVLLQAFVDDI